MTRSWPALALCSLSTLAVALPLAGCGDREFIVVEKETPKRPIGDSCQVDDQCSTGRCVAGACDDGQCDTDQDCRVDEICVFGACEPSDEFACTPDQAPILSLTPALNLEFGQVAVGQTAEQTVTVENIGDCLLTIHGISLDDVGDPGFGCEPCDAASFPQRVPPRRSLDVVVHYAPPGPGEAFNQLQINTDDVTAGDEGLVVVDLHAAYDGVPSLSVSPAELNFGFVEFVAGGAQGSATQELLLTNRGSGNAALVLERIFVDEGTDFSIPAEFDAVDPDNTLVIPPYDANDPATEVHLPVTFRPTRAANFEDAVVLRPLNGDNIRVRLSGSSLGPPQIEVTATSFVYKCGVSDPCPVGEAYPVGQIAFRQFFIRNNGASELSIVNLTLGGEASDFTISPSFIAPIPPQGAVPVTVFFAPTSPSDPNPANRLDPQEPFSASLSIASNDTDPPTDALKTISLEGWSKGGDSDDVLVLEMNYENADNSWAGNDFRNVDLVLTSETFGFQCTKPLYIRDAAGNLAIDPNGNYCDQWNAGGQEGHVNWLALGSFEEPERISFFGLGPTGAEGHEFLVKAVYQEDCANIPSGLLANILGIGGSILLGVLGGAVGIPIAVDPGAISSTIANNCFDHASSLTTLHIKLNGQEVAAPQTRLHEKGDVVDLIRLKRKDGQFCNADPGATVLPCN